MLKNLVFKKPDKTQTFTEYGSVYFLPVIWGLRRDDFVMKLINMLIRELDNCSLGVNFRVSLHAEICQFNRFSLEINFKRAHSCNYGIPRLCSS